MRDIVKKIAYLRGLCEGYGIGKNTKEGMIFSGIFDVLDELTEEVENIELSNSCDRCNDEEPEYSYAFICPSCGQELEVDEETLEKEEDLNCPACGNIIPLMDEFATFDDEENK